MDKKTKYIDRFFNKYNARDARIYLIQGKKGSVCHVDFFDSAGKRHKSSLHTSLRTIAKLRALEKVKLFEENISKGINGTSNDITFAEVSAIYLEAEKDKKISWDDRKERIHRLHLVPSSFGNSKIKDIKSSDWSIYKKERKTQVIKQGGSKGKYPSSREIEFEGCEARRCVNFAIEKGMYQGKNPFSNFEMDEYNNERKRIVTNDEQFLLLQEAPDYYKPIIVTKDETGMRTSEFLDGIYEDKATPEDLKTNTLFDIENGIIKIPEAPGKKTGRRPVPMTEILMDVLKKNRERFPDCKYVFTADGKTQFNNHKDIWDKIRKKLGIKDLQFHDYRGTFVSRKSQENIPISNIMEYAGIKTLNIFRRYNIITDDNLYGVAGRKAPKNVKNRDNLNEKRHYAIWKIMGIKCKCCTFDKNTRIHKEVKNGEVVILPVVLGEAKN